MNLQAQLNLFCRLETENRQLREVVTQLRNAHKSTQESADIALADRQSYFDTIEQQRKELQVLREKLTNYNSLSEENPQLLQEVCIDFFFLLKYIRFILYKIHSNT